MRLNPAQIEAFQPTEKPAKLTDGDGLYLLVQPTGRKLWRYRFRFAGKQNTLSCGIYPDISLDEARGRAAEFRSLLAAGVNPAEHVKAERGRIRANACSQAQPAPFLLDSHGGLTFRLGRKHVALTPAETADLRTFLDATRDVIAKE